MYVKSVRVINMKRVFALVATTVFIFLIVSGCESSGNSSLDSYGEQLEEVEFPDTSDIPELPPQLNVVLFNTGLANQPAQSIHALQLSASWMVVDENGVGSGIEADAPHPLQMTLDAYDDASLLLNNAKCRCIDWKDHLAVELLFGDNYPSDSVSVVRWNSSLLTGNQDIDDIINEGEPVDIAGNTFPVLVDEHNYVYAIYATWPEGRSSYAFRTDLRP